jgi:hypothetical protein
MQATLVFLFFLKKKVHARSLINYSFATHHNPTYNPGYSLTGSTHKLLTLVYYFFKKKYV